MKTRDKITISKERYQYLLDCEKLTEFVCNAIIADSLPNIELTREAMIEISNDDKMKAVQAAFTEALKQKGE